jgi:hypothetical protein
MEPTATTPPEGEEQQQGMKARRRPPKSPEARQRGLVARKLARKVEALKGQADVAKLEKAVATLEALTGGSAEEAPEAKPAQPEERPREESQVQQGTPAGVNPRGPAWPSEQAIAEFTPVAAQLVARMVPMLHGTRFAIDVPQQVQVGEHLVTVTAADQLTAGLAPVLAKYLPAAVNTPEAALALTLFTVFGVPGLQLAAEKFAEAMRARRAA